MSLPTLLVFSAHPSDFCSRAGGTIALYTGRGARVHVVVMTYGERDRSEDYWRIGGERSLAEARQARRAEAEEAAKILGASIEFMGFEDEPLQFDGARIDGLARLVRTHRPDAVLTHWRQDPFEAGHAATTAAALRAITTAASPGFDYPEPKAALPYVFGFEPTLPRNEAAGFLPDHFVDIDEVFELKMRALGALKSQTRLVGTFTLWSEYRALQACQQSNHTVRHAEAFQRLTPTVDTALPLRRV